MDPIKLTTDGLLDAIFAARTLELLQQQVRAALIEAALGESPGPPQHTEGERVD